MKVPVQISFRDFPSSDALSAAVQKRADKLDHLYDKIISCRVVVESPHRSHHKGNIYHVRVDVTVPGEEIVVGRDVAKGGAHKDVYIAVRDAFDAMERQLKGYLRRKRVRVHMKERAIAPHAKVIRLHYEGNGDNFGFLRTADGRELYFHRNSVLNEEFETLKVGDEVRFSEEQGEEGPQASTVERVGRDQHQL